MYSGRETLRGAEEQTFDSISQVLEPEEWAEWLRAPLERAAATGNRGLARRLMVAGADVGDAMRKAVRGGHKEVVEDLLKNGVSVRSRDKDGGTALHVAARAGNAEMVHLLMLRGGDKNAIDSDKNTPLYWAISGRHNDAVLALVAGGADVNLRCGYTNTTLPCTAIRKGGVDILRILIKHGADVDARDIDSDTALHVAAAHDEEEAITVLIEAGADIEARGRLDSTPIHMAAERLSLGALAALLRHDANVNAQNSQLQTPLHHAVYKCAQQGAAQAVDLLLRSGADETLEDKDYLRPADLSRSHFANAYKAQYIGRVNELLKNAPADRAWRRRGYLVLCRAHPDRMQQRQGINGIPHEGAADMTQNGSKAARRGESGVNEKTGGRTVEERNDAHWATVVARVLGLKEEGIFRYVLGYL